MTHYNLFNCRVTTILIQLLIFIPLDGAAANWANYKQNPFSIKLSPLQNNISGRGGLIVADLNSDGLLDYLVSTQVNDSGSGRATIAAYDHFGEIIWVIDNVAIILNGKAEDNGLPGWSGPGLSVSDVDGDGHNEVIHLNLNNDIIIRDGLSGEEKKKIHVDLPSESLYDRIQLAVKVFWQQNWKKAIRAVIHPPKRWAHFQVVNLQGEKDDEIILQADPLPFRWLKAVSLTDGKVLWENNQYSGLQHGGFRAADVDQDGFDEVVGAVFIDHDGVVKNNWQYRKFPGHFDSLFIGDILKEEPGLEWILLEEGHGDDDRTTLLGAKKIYFYHSFIGWEPQNAAVGEFDLEKEGLEIWCRSRFTTDQKPWVLDSKGETIASYRLNDMIPDHWSSKGIEFIYSIDWDGNNKQYLAAKERHVDGKIAIIDPLTGEFMRWWNEHAARIYVVDTAGDYREEIIVINNKENEIRIYWNDKENQSQQKDGRYWDLNSYKRQKLNYNYYSP